MQTLLHVVHLAVLVLLKVVTRVGFTCTYAGFCETLQLKEV